MHKFILTILGICLFGSMLAQESNTTTPSGKPAAEQLKELFGRLQLNGLFSEPDVFGKNVRYVYGGPGLRGNLGDAIRNQDGRKLVPSLYVGYEHGIHRNIGIGLQVGSQVWRVPFLEDGSRGTYTYLTASLRGLYHLNVNEKLDPYMGMALSYRNARFSYQKYATARSKVSFGLILGMRYFLRDSWGVFFEIGNDATSFYKFGLFYNL